MARPLALALIFVAVHRAQCASNDVRKLGGVLSERNWHSHGSAPHRAPTARRTACEQPAGRDADPSCGLPAGAACRAVPDPSLRVPPFVSPYTAPDIPLLYAAQPDGQAQPEQVALFPAVSNGSVLTVRFMIPSTLPLGERHVSFGTDPHNLSQLSWGSPSHYSYGLGTEGQYISGQIYFVSLGPLLPATLYFYHIQGLDTLFNFTSLPALGHPTLHLALVGDVGQTYNSSATLANVRRSNASLVLFAGDLSYADHYDAPCKAYRGRGAGQDEAGVCGKGGLRWDSWGRMSQHTFAYKPAAYVPGNHELELSPWWGEVEPFKPYAARVPGLLDDLFTSPHPQKQGRVWPSRAPLFYSLDIGPAHIIGLSSYSPFILYSHQHYWLREDLCSIDRDVTPWVIVFLHVPLYSSNIEHYAEGEAMRGEVEGWLHEAGVDLVVGGHVHAYERSHPVYQMVTSADGCAAVHVTVGAGGNIEEVAGPFVEPQPSYSAYREESFGHAELVIDGPTSATYSWYRNQKGAQVLGDTFSFLNQARVCGRRRPTFCK